MQASLKRWTSKLPDISAVMARFPVAVVSMAICTLLFILFKNGITDTHERIGRLCLGLIIGAYVSVSMTLNTEARGKARALVLQIIIAAIIAMLSWFSIELRLNLPMVIGAVILALGNAVRWRRERDDLHVWDFTHKLWTGVVFAVVGSVIFLIGLLAITAALKSLFGIRLDNLMEDFLLPIGFGFFAPLYWLSTLPPANEGHQDLHDNPGFVSKAVAFMGTWLLAPLTLIYAVILLAYGVKIGIARALPNGEIAQLTLPFLIVGTLTWLVLEPPFIQAKRLASIFRRAWWPLSIAASVLLAISVFVRVSEYGYTPERFALMIGVLWALGMGLWFTFGPKAQRDIRLIPGSAAALLLLGTFSAGGLSFNSQSARLAAGLKAAGIMTAEGNVVSPIAFANRDAARNAKGALLYLLSHEGTNHVIALAQQAGLEVSDKDDNAQITKAFGLDKVSIRNRWTRNEEITYNRPEGPLSIKGYDRLRGPLTLYTHSNSSHKVINDDGMKATIKSKVLTLELLSGETFDFDARQWIDNQKFDVGMVSRDNIEITLLDDGSRKIVLNVQRFNRWAKAQREVDGSRERFNMEVYILTKGLDP